MHQLLQALKGDMTFTGELKQDVYEFLVSHHRQDTADHCMEVGAEARRVAIRFGANPEAAEIAGWLHDISGVIPNEERIAAARVLDIDVLPEEEMFPMIIHQKLSKVIARDMFHITNTEILDAVECHTTLKANSTKLDQVLFVADKIAWDQVGEAPYIQQLMDGLDVSLTQGAFSYIEYLWERKESLRVLHPWLKDAYEQLNNK